MKTQFAVWFTFGILLAGIVLIHYAATLHTTIRMGGLVRLMHR